MAYCEADVQRLVDTALAEKMATERVHSVRSWKDKYREQVLRNEASQPGYIKRTCRMLDDLEKPGPMPERGRAMRHLEPPAIVIRRLYEAKLADLALIGAGTRRERQQIAIDYACGEVHRCDVAPFPRGGLPQLEDELCVAISFDRNLRTA